jgi:hypothetical protein
MVSRTVTALVATLLAAVAQSFTYLPTFLLEPLDLGSTTFPVVHAGFSVLALLVGPVGAALLGAALDADLPADRTAVGGLFAVAGTVGYVVAAGGFLLLGPGATTLQPLWAVGGSALLRLPGAVVPFALAGFAGAAYSYLAGGGPGERGSGRRRSHSLGGPDDGRRRSRSD